MRCNVRNAMRNFPAELCMSCMILLIYIAGLVALPVGIGIFVSVKNGKLGGERLYRSGYICGKEPPTREDIAARGNISTCLDVLMSGSFGRSFSSLCLQAGGLDKPAVWCNEEDEYYSSYYLWWSPCDKCGTAWRIFDSIDNDQSWYKRPTSPQPNNTELPPTDGWLGWQASRQEWESVSSVYIDTCYNMSLVSEATNISEDTRYDIPSSCFSDEIFVGKNPWHNAGLALLVIGGIFWGCTLLSFCPESDSGRGGSDYGGG
eukprot:CAMPEP_0201696990 /NCGR_PEP_ID=MMETSP0578-20130828/8987_1 /ASSEMBLY_ACC=CAM_ASM_000663 /TAXON_ID=267565 /ORGANISM="Skeletonema grethea, Strain CCMP 1804" /LENGTH=260 /DNA_ID=CAMNT_0048183039 /DNA_START=156 /DNA_END=935 /DNA_ORIENTATION=-